MTTDEKLDRIIETLKGMEAGAGRTQDGSRRRASARAAYRRFLRYHGYWA